MSTPMFVKNTRIQKAVTLINNLDSSKFPLLLTRILQKIHLKKNPRGSHPCKNPEKEPLKPMESAFLHLK
ncbi:hypothetical protein TNIN_67871 [Trichonephila inaurata madagascariensis]|uniref:Uncharacterized protein n=1 Tax=Trichonephila inaurata madagascariensis TaxID=2747483 RepID=A0A8X6XJI4_9ARAC|nr:hypothetical protein TNIN_67871 [Trichonephila inaurata madagascariensis]